MPTASPRRSIPTAQRTQRSRAGKTFIRQLYRAIEERKSVVVESTLAGKSIGRMLKRFQKAGYTLRIAFLFLDTPEMCIQRVKERVQQGGHDVPRSDIRRRFHRSILNFWSVYRNVADRWYLFYNAEDQLQQVAFGEQEEWAVLDEASFNTFQELVASADEYTR